MLPRRAAVATLLSLGTGGLLAGACTAEEPAPPAPLTVGLLADTSAARGTDAVAGAELAVDLVNNPHPDLALPLAAKTGVGGASGTPLRLEVTDTAGAPEQAEAAVTALARDGAVALVVAGRADVVALAGPAADRARLPLVDAVSSADYLLDVGLEWYFRTAPTDHMRAQAVFGFLAGTTGADQVTLLTTPDGDTTDVAAPLVEAARSAGYATTVEVAAAGEQYGATPGDPILPVAATAAQARELAGAVADPPGSTVVVAGRGFHRLTDPAPAGALRPASWSSAFAARQPVARAVDARYRERHDRPMSMDAAAAFTATLAVAQAADAAGASATADPADPADAAAVRAALRQLSVPAIDTIMPWDGIRFGADGQNQLAAVVVEQYRPGGPEVVHPAEISTAALARPPGAAP